MPTFEVVSLQQAKNQSELTGKRGTIILEYLAYIDRVEPGKAGKLSIKDGETSAAIKRRLGTAARHAGKTMVVKRVGDDIFFWPEERRRGRPRKGR